MADGQVVGTTRNDGVIIHVKKNTLQLKCGPECPFYLPVCGGTCEDGGQAVKGQKCSRGYQTVEDATSAKERV